MSSYTKTNLGKRVWLITETTSRGDKNYIAAMAGMERAVIINTGSGEGDLRAFIEEIFGTEMPLFCICTRADAGTVGGAGQFDEAYISDGDFQLLTPEQQSFFMKTFDGDHHHLGGVHVGVYHAGSPTCGSVRVICTREGQQLFYFEPDFTDSIRSELIPEPVIIEDGILKGMRPGVHETRIMLPEGVTEVADGAFEGNLELSFIKFPSTLKRIGRRAFYACRNLTLAELPEGLEELGEGAFGITGQLQLCFPPSLKVIAKEAYDGCMAHHDLHIPSTVEEVGELSFSANHGLRKVRLDEGVKKIGRRAFNGIPELEDMNLPHSVIEIGPYAFDGTNAPQEAVLNGEIRVLGRDAFAGCHGLRKVVIEEGIEVLEDRAFAYCNNLEEVVLPSSIKKIGKRCFSGCTKLRKINIPEGTEIGENAFYACPGVSVTHWHKNSAGSAAGL